MKFSTILMTLGALGSCAAWALPQAANVEAALPIAKEQGRDIMLEFTGKEWCPPCIHLRTKIMETPEFEKAVGDKYVLVEVIFPRLPSAVAAIPKEQRNANEQLLVHHRIETGLPTVLLLDEKGLPYAQVAGARRTTAEYLKELDAAAAVRAARDAAFARAAGLKGMERATALVEGLNAIPENCRDKYVDIVNEINELDPQNTPGLCPCADPFRQLPQAGCRAEGHFRPPAQPSPAGGSAGQHRDAPEVPCYARSGARAGPDGLACPGRHLRVPASL
ncbi:MAG: thioredoxin family protein [Akkermansia sp.]|nr:thioredoxin family protein [Akkermansia sp.]